MSEGIEKSNKAGKKGFIARLMGFFFWETPLIMTVAISFFVSGLTFYFLSPQVPKVVYSFDTEKFKTDLIQRAGITGLKPESIEGIAQDLREMLDLYAERGKTVVINRRAYLALDKTSFNVVDITNNVERKIFEKYNLPASVNPKLFKLLNKGGTGEAKPEKPENR